MLHKCGGETSPRPFSGNLILSISLDLSCMPSWRLSKYIEVSYRPVAFTWYLVLFLKKKSGVELVYLSHFLHRYFKEKYFSCHILFITWLFLFRDILDSMCIKIFLIRLWCHEFWNYLIFLTKPIFMHEKFTDENVNVMRMKRSFR